MFRRSASFAILLLVLVGITHWFLVAVTEDPFGLSVAPAIKVENAGRVEPLYGLAWTGEQSVDWSPDGERIATAGGFSTSIIVTDARTGRETHRATITGLLDTVRWSPDGRWIAVASEDTFLNGPMRISIFTASCTLVASWVAHNTLLSEGLAWSPDGGRLLTSSGGQFAVWEAGSWAEVLRATNVSTSGSSASWSPDGTRFVLASEGPRVYDAQTGQLLWSRMMSIDGWTHLAWSPKGDLIAVSSSTGVHLYDGEGLDQGEILAGRYGRLSWSPDGSMLALTSDVGVALISVAERAVVQRLVFPVTETRPAGTMAGWGTLDHDVAWSPRGTAIAVTGTESDLSLRMWAIPQSPIGIPLATFGVAWLLGLVGVLRTDIRVIVRRPERALTLWGDGEYLLLVGRPLFYFAMGGSLLFALIGYGIGRISSLQPIPSLAWFWMNAILSLLVGVPAALLAVLAFGAAAWPSRSVRPRGTPARSMFAAILLPFLVVLPAIWIFFGAILVAGMSLSLFRSSFAPALATGILLGIGIAWSGRVASGIPGVVRWRAWWAVTCSALASLGTFIGLVVLFVIFLNVMRVQPSGEIRAFGFQFVFAFGFVPFLVVLGSIVVAAFAGGSAAVIRPVLPGYSRIQRDQVMELEARQTVMRLVETHPGTHFRDLVRMSRQGSGTTLYHLYVLEREGFVVARREGTKKRFYAIRPQIHAEPSPR
jgi:WD40 repeat protein